MNKLSLESNFKSLQPFEIEVPDFTVLTGLNGSGKTHILQALDSYVCGFIDEYRATSLKYVDQTSLIPNEDTHSTKEIYKQEMENFWQEYQETRYRRQDSQENLRPELNDVLKQVAKNSDKDISSIDYDDFIKHFPVTAGFSKTEIFRQNFANIFKKYYDKQTNNDFAKFQFEKYGDEAFKYITEEEFITRYGNPPWDIANEVLNNAKLDYAFNSPVGTHTDVPFDLVLINKYSGARISFKDLSSGEKVLMSLALLFYNSDYDMIYPKVLLMDEPDAFLHPSMVKQFLEVIQKVFVEDRQVKVIMTTHSPSTVAFAPDDSLFIVSKNPTQIENVSKDKALKILSTGVPSFSINLENRRQVFVESENDVLFYGKIYQQLEKLILPDISLSFISSGVFRTDKNGMKISNCGQVELVNKTLRGYGNQFILGIVDFDGHRKNDDSIFILGNGNRYAIENYVFDPLILAALLLREKLVNPSQLGLEEDQTLIHFRNYDENQIQSIVDKMVLMLKPEPNSTESEVVQSGYVNGMRVNIPKWYYDIKGHSLENHLIMKIFPTLNDIKRGEEPELKLEVINKVFDDLPGFIPVDFLILFISLQEF